MPRPLPLAIAAVALAALLGGAGCSDDVSPAIRIGDAAVSHDELADELDEWAGNTQTQASQALPVPGVEHGYALEPATSIIGERILLGIFEQEFEERGLEVTDDDRTNAFALIGIDPAQEEQLLGGFSDDYRQTYLDRWAKVAAVQADVGSEEDLRSLIDERADDVELSSRYGTWDAAQFAVIPPTGPATQADGEPSDAAQEPTTP